ncbi:PREDICTED: ankyrin repeat-containing protein NPR4-like [Tarenaya hassleriana]|uniref:ankyrin repeat-containing protein NPR4-like n=1 Tax=Tarenaya hassleriana TaxID=28532 RepID=UPI00053C0D22|nr:PREDICTED: ankyrin repeat-containing protein NPR4-like [Tarenaya hassleriana]
MDQRLTQAAQSGSVHELYDLIDDDPYVLDKIESVPFINTPLHAAAANGRTAFAMEMMNLKPSFAKKLNPNGFSPLHVALDKDQTRLALELLKFDPSLVRVRGRQGMMPLHLVVRKGDTELVTEFILACPECIRDVNVNGETALHIAVINDRYEELRVITGWVQRMRQKDASFLEIQVLNRRDQDGNTALHVAAYENKHEARFFLILLANSHLGHGSKLNTFLTQAVKLLLGSPGVNRNIENRNGLTALDILQTRRQDIDRDMEKMVRRSGAKNSASLSRTKKTSEFLGSPVTFFEYWSTTMARYRNHISDGTRSALLVIASLIISTTYQTALQPPGGVHQDTGKVVMTNGYFQVLRNSNGMAIWSAILMTFLLLPVGGEHLWFFLLISMPLYISYAVSMAAISPDSTWYLISVGISLITYIVIYLVIFFFKWKRSKLKKIPKSRSELISEGFTTLSLARGVEQSQMFAW